VKKIAFLCFFGGVLALTSFVEANDEYFVKKKPYAPYLTPDKLTVVASFDGSKSLERWQDILDFADKKQVKFTFFISGVYFVSDDDKKSYLYPPDMSIKGRSDIGFGGTGENIEKRKNFVLKAMAAGHDVQTHLNGHFDGSRWSEDAWRNEFDQFSRICAFMPSSVKHVRFPLLAMNHKVFPVLAAAGVKSVMSDIENDYENFNLITLKYGATNYQFAEFPIAYEKENGARILLMDYNFYLYDEKHRIDPDKAEKDMIALYLDEAERCMRDKRPFFISHHFSNWNHAAYWDAMQQVISEVKKKYPTEFLTVSELYDRVSK